MSEIYLQDILPFMAAGKAVEAVIRKDITDMSVGEIVDLANSGAHFFVPDPVEVKAEESTEVAEISIESVEEPVDTVEEPVEEPAEPEEDEDDKLDEEVVQNIIKAVGDAVSEAEESQTVTEVPQLAEEAPKKRAYVKHGTGKVKIDDGKIRALWEAGWTVKEIALDFHCDVSTIYNHIKAMGLRRD